MPGALALKGTRPPRRRAWMPWGLVLGLPSMSTASVSGNRIAHRPCACAPDAFRSGCGRVDRPPVGSMTVMADSTDQSDISLASCPPRGACRWSASLWRLLGSQEVPLRFREPSLGLAACDTVCLTSRVPRDVIEPRPRSQGGRGSLSTQPLPVSLCSGGGGRRACRGQR